MRSQGRLYLERLRKRGRRTTRRRFMSPPSLLFRSRLIDFSTVPRSRGRVGSRVASVSCSPLSSPHSFHLPSTPSLNFDMFERMGVVSTDMGKGREGTRWERFVGSVAGMNPDPEDVKREEEVREKATRNPLKLQELIEQEREARRKEGGSQPAVIRVTICSIRVAVHPSVRRSVGGAWPGRSTEPVPRTSVVSPPPVAPKGGLRGGKRPSGWWNWKSEVSIFGTRGFH